MKTDIKTLLIIVDFLLLVIGILLFISAGPNIVIEIVYKNPIIGTIGFYMLVMGLILLILLVVYHVLIE